MLGAFLDAFGRQAEGAGAYTCTSAAPGIASPDPVAVRAADRG